MGGQYGYKHYSNHNKRYNNYNKYYRDDNGWELPKKQKKQGEWIACAGQLPDGSYCKGWNWKSSMGPSQIV